MNAGLTEKFAYAAHMHANAIITCMHGLHCICASLYGVCI